MVLDALPRLDHRLFRRTQASRHWQQRAWLARWISRTGDGPPYVLLGLFFWLSREAPLQAYVLDLLLAFALELPLYLSLKNGCRRRRPALALPDARAYIAPSDRFSLPSGHTAAAMLVASLSLLHFGAAAWPVLPWALLVGWSRVWLGVHFPSDILAGLLLGGMVALLVF
ncbi:phosphatase PAP2 family protein [Zobellella denitrificans]|uniref:phosphatase PAP2 family protein n=1 Tax=Zobellella denitrificans TaxID=347534 RepID=UPI000B8C0243|nr:phosphatase PAP2 family protein [Zobellella denitrificans]OXS16202.1 phosphatase PAP2 family protein [Zobellella denitrificans]